MSRIGRSVLVFALVLWAGNPSLTRSEDSPALVPKLEAVDRILTDWQEHTSKIRSLETEFEAIEHSRAFGDTRSVGRLRMVLPNLASVDVWPLDEQRQPTKNRESVVWTGRSWIRFESASNRAMILVFEEESTATPEFLSLYFLFNMTADRARRDHDWQIVKETETSITLKATVKSHLSSFKLDWSDLFGMNKPILQTFFIELDRKTFETRRIIVPKESDFAEFRTIRSKRNPDLDIESLRHPKTEGWKISEKRIESNQKIFPRLEDAAQKND